MHLFIVDGVGSVVADIQQDDLFRSSLEQLVTPLVQGLSSAAGSKLRVSLRGSIRV